MVTETIPHPPITMEAEWLAARLALLEKEKELTRQYDRVSAERRRLPMVKLDKQYVLEGPGGMVKFIDTFEGRRQLIVYHFMFDPEWSQGCSGCTGYVNAIGDISMLAENGHHLRVGLPRARRKVRGVQGREGWTLPWYSSLDSDFNYDFHVTLDEKVAPKEYNYRNKEERRAGGTVRRGEEHGLSVFFRLGDEIFHTYSTYARGTENLVNS